MLSILVSQIQSLLVMDTNFGGLEENFCIIWGLVIRRAYCKSKIRFANLEEFWTVVDSILAYQWKVIKRLGLCCQTNCCICDIIYKCTAKSVDMSSSLMSKRAAKYWESSSVARACLCVFSMSIKLSTLVYIICLGLCSATLCTGRPYSTISQQDVPARKNHPVKRGSSWQAYFWVRM